MTYSHENKTTRWRWQQFVLSLSVAMWSFVDSPSALLAQETTKYPTLPTGSGITQSSWETWHTRDDEGWASYNIARVFHREFLSSNEQRAAKNAFTYYALSADAGYARAQANLGFCHDIGLGTDKNSDKAKHWYGEAANQGNLVGQLNYAQKLLAEGIASDNRESILKARDWFKKAHGQYAG
ncbi:MAG: tetratricopeptide repeat protein, partial [Verrucomicrobiota bacterium]|nr:tetratricopeptide repeat protein [Verrucomicrobiota bacterium]